VARIVEAVQHASPQSPGVSNGDYPIRARPTQHGESKRLRAARQLRR